MGYKSYKLCKAPDARQALNKYQISLGSKMSSVVTIAFLRRKNNDRSQGVNRLHGIIGQY